MEKHHTFAICIRKFKIKTSLIKKLPPYFLRRGEGFFEMIIK